FLLFQVTFTTKMDAEKRHNKLYFDYTLKKFHSDKDLKELIGKSRYECVGGTVASYISELAKVSGDLLGMAMYLLDGKILKAGDAEHRFSIQSISKTLTLLYCLIKRGEEFVFSRIGKEPTGDPFNSGLRLEVGSDGKSKKPNNPFINAGAIVSASLFPGKNAKDKFQQFLRFVQELLDDDEITLDEGVYLSEKKDGHRNRALSYLMRESNILVGGAQDIENVLDVYFKSCSLNVTCVNLARFGVILAGLGWDPVKQKQVIPTEFAVKLMVLMSSCGLYDDSGNFAFDVGIPAKSGVGGGIIGAVPNKLGIATFSPPLDMKGNSVKGKWLFLELSRQEGLSIYGSASDRSGKDKRLVFEKELNKLFKEIVENMYADEGFIEFIDHQNFLDIQANLGDFYYFSSNKGFGGKVFNGNEPQIAEIDTDIIKTSGTYHGEIAAPIEYKGKNIGVLLLDRVEGEGKVNIDSILPQNFDQRDLKVVKMWADRITMLLKEHDIEFI
ncbi:MAG: glutaminase A, partial [Ignavibacteriaceae bacterium]